MRFFDIGSVGSASNINNTVDGSFSGTIASLQFGNTNNTHTTLISSGTTLNITGANGLVVGTSRYWGRQSVDQHHHRRGRVVKL